MAVLQGWIAHNFVIEVAGACNTFKWMPGQSWFSCGNGTEFIVILPEAATTAVNQQYEEDWPVRASST